jgi:hypothetical protein
VERPALGWEQLAFGLETSVGGPELRGEDEAAEGLGAAGVELEGRVWGVGFGAAGENWLVCVYVLESRLYEGDFFL